MAIVTLCDQNLTLRDPQKVEEHLASIGIDYERWVPAHPIEPGTPAEEVLQTYSAEIDKLKERGGYVTADVIDVSQDTPGLDQMLAKFNREHWHDEDEVRFIIEGRGIFHVHSSEAGVTAIEVEAGDLIRVPRGTHHWFNLCSDRRIRAIRLFQDPAGWAPNYTASEVDANYQPVCLGGSYFPREVAQA
jgi:1,2-dihydroxy-3-keto-5-methylthiopentene dioxygenase